MGTRPYARLGIADLEKLARDVSSARTVKEAVLAELRHRSVPRAKALLEYLEKTLSSSSRDDVARTKPRRFERERGKDTGSSAANQISQEKPTPDITALPRRDTIDNDPADILGMWTALEVLSPVTFNRPSDLAGGDMRRIARLDRELPWFRGPAKGPPGYRLYFQIVLGSVVMPSAIDQLLQRFGDSRPERPQGRGETPLAVVIVDREGRPIPDSCAVASSFGWGLPRALQGDPVMLGEWRDAGDHIQGALHKHLYRERDDGKAAPLDEATILAAHRWLVEQFGIDPSIVKPPSFAIRSTVSFKSSEPPEALLLNSFYLKDLSKASALLKEDKAPDSLKRFLGMIEPTARRDLLNDEEAIEGALSPALFPSGRWPGPGRHPLVLMQQAAVNLALSQGVGEILAVNGPPGTGKTTLLRDVVAALVTQRASIMAGYQDPETAFTHSGEKLNLGGGWIHLYKLDQQLKGFEMLVASSNNKAVENVSRELPAIGAVSDDAPDIRYFKPMADTLLGQESWGAIAAVLGNAGNRSAFKTGFWWDKDTGLFNYFKAINGAKPEFELPDGSTRTPRIISELDPPRDRRSALRNWQSARKQYQALEKKVAETSERVERFRLKCRHLPVLRNAWDSVRAHSAERPGIWQRLFNLRGYREWRADHENLSSTLAEAGKRAKDKNLLSTELFKRLARSPWIGFRAHRRAAAIEIMLGQVLADWNHEREMRPAVAIDDFFFDAGREHIQGSSPWFSPEEHRERDALFEAALVLHKAFVDAAAKPLRHNIGAALQVIDGKGLGDGRKDALIPDLWSSLFLIVPVLSTTFASVGTMLGRLPSEALGWLLVDEAGQAAPQQAVGAIMRAKRAIVVGDPIQVPPVVQLPDRLTNAMGGSFGVAAERFAAPTASVQTLADDATASFAEFPARLGARTVGVPLLVHRRCSEPMFGIANRVAYEGLMVQAKQAKGSAIRDLLGLSAWIDTLGVGSDKWCAEEGQIAIAMLERIVLSGLELDLYVVTPFVQVANGLRDMIRESPVLIEAIPDVVKWSYERVGTIHTVQGREADTVIFVLGAPNIDQTGARAWAGKEPNLLNVAMTRAKEAVYVIGNRRLWLSAGVFGELANLPSASQVN